MQKYALSTIMWVEALAKKEIEKAWGKIEEVIDNIPCITEIRKRFYKLTIVD